MTSGSIMPFEERRRDEALDVLAEAYRIDPWHAVWFGGVGPDRLPINRRWLAYLLDHPCKGEKKILVHDGAIVGFAHWQASSGREPPPDEASRKAIVEALGKDALGRMAPLLAAFRDHAPHEPHIRFGPIAVHPSLQGKGLGGALMASFCEHVDRANAMSWLETSKPENVRFYAKFGFDVVHDLDIEGLRAWFMRRPKQAG